MKHHQSVLGAAAAVLLSLGAVAILADRQGTATPSHHVAQQFQAGRIVVNLPHDLTNRFHFRNDTGEKIEITEIKPSCGCTKVAVPIRSFEPGATGWLEATASLHASGPFSTDVAVHWSSGEVTRYAMNAFVQVARELSLSAMSVDLDVDEPRTLVLTYIDQEGEAPGPVVLESPEALKVEVGPWQPIIVANKEYGIAARYSAMVSVRLTEPIEQLSRASFSLASQPGLARAELVVRTPALVRAYALKHESRRPSTGPIVIQHAAEPQGDDQSSGPDEP